MWKRLMLLLQSGGRVKMRLPELWRMVKVARDVLFLAIGIWIVIHEYHSSEINEEKLPEAVTIPHFYYVDIWRTLTKDPTWRRYFPNLSYWEQSIQLYPSLSAYEQENLLRPLVNVDHIRGRAIIVARWVPRHELPQGQVGVNEVTFFMDAANLTNYACRLIH